MAEVKSIMKGGQTGSGNHKEPTFLEKGSTQWRNLLNCKHDGQLTGILLARYHGQS